MNSFVKSRVGHSKALILSPPLLHLNVGTGRGPQIQFCINNLIPCLTEESPHVLPHHLHTSRPTLGEGGGAPGKESKGNSFCLPLAFCQPQVPQAQS